MSLISGPSILTRKLTGVRVTGVGPSSTVYGTGFADHGTWATVDGDLDQSLTAQTVFGGATFPVTTTGLKSTKQVWRLLLPFRYDVALAVRMRLHALVSTPSAGACTLRLVVTLRNTAGGTPLATANSDTFAGNVGATATLRMKLDTASVGWTAGQYLDVEMQPEVTVASGTGGDVAAVALRHDAGGAEPLLMEIDV